MNRLKIWLYKEASLWTLLRQLPLITMVVIDCSGLCYYIASQFFSPASLSANGEAVAQVLNKENFYTFLFSISVLAPPIEELLLRAFPLATMFIILRSVKPKNNFSKNLIIALTVLTTSIVFGYGHGIGNILIQGPAGFVFSIVFLKWSGFGQNIWKGWVACSVVHASFNGTFNTGTALFEKWLD